MIMHNIPRAENYRGVKQCEYYDPVAGCCRKSEVPKHYGSYVKLSDVFDVLNKHWLSGQLAHHIADDIKKRMFMLDSENINESEVPKAPLIKTNGDVFKEMFPDAKIACQETLAVAGQPHYRVVAEIDWWNAPYKGEEA